MLRNAAGGATLTAIFAALKLLKPTVFCIVRTTPFNRARLPV